MPDKRSSYRRSRAAPSPTPPPSHRRLRVYSFDPSLSAQLDTALINETVLDVPWEEDLERGPVGEYLEVVDFDPASDCFYAPIDLNDPHLLARDGLAPSEGNAQFHQQMVYAVAMTTIKNFERALGRKALWAPHIERDPDNGGFQKATRVPRLRIYPHALREANAYYSPDKKALLFGYFPAVLADPGENLPGGLVFTCLSHDVVAHETTHALLDGLHRYFDESSNPDVLAFHEAFADIVALFQHFTQPEALRHQIAKTRGDLADQNLLGELAHQFGQAIGNHGALRDAIGGYDEETEKWVPRVPDPEDYHSTTEPHDRGAILVAAMFDAFVALYKTRTADLLRIATGGTGVLPEGHLHPDLVNRLADEATKTADHILRMAIRALDYCPPVDITFGEYLRALITGDADLFPDDPLRYRTAVIEGFRRRGIYPRGVRTLAADSLLWQRPGSDAPRFVDLIRKLKSGWDPDDKPENKAKARRDLPTFEWQGGAARDKIDRLNHQFQYLTWRWIKDHLFGPRDSEEDRREAARALGLVLHADAPSTIFRGDIDGLPSLEVHSVRSSRRPTEDGRTKIDLVIGMTQRRRGYVDAAKQKQAEELAPDAAQWRSPEFKHDFIVRGGCTLLIDSETGDLRYCITKDVADNARLARQRNHVGAVAEPSLRATYLPPPPPGARVPEPFALLHRSR